MRGIGLLLVLLGLVLVVTTYTKSTGQVLQAVFTKA